MVEIPPVRDESDPLPRRRAGRVRRAPSGRAQLSLVEHALCPLDPNAGLRDHLVHQSVYGYTDRHGHLKSARVRVICPSGLSPADEFVLWGLLALTFAQPTPSTEFHATPYYCLCHLGLHERGGGNGGKDYVLFRETVKRLARVVYESSAFYDPVRGEHRDVGFGFLKYSLPITAGSSRAWRFVWDQQFFEFAQATGGGLWFDLQTYRGLDFGSRRLFVFLQKVFYRATQSPALDVRKLCVDVLGFSPTIEMPQLKQKLTRCVEELAREGIVRLPTGRRVQELFVKRGVGCYAVTLSRGAYFEGKQTAAVQLTTADSPLIDPLRAVGFEDNAIHRIVGEYPAALVQQWADITLAARERHGEDFFKKSAAAYFTDNIRHAAKGRRSPPDWWRELRQEEVRRQRAADRDQSERVCAASEEDAFRAYLEGEAREAFSGVMRKLVGELTDHGKSSADAEESARYITRLHFLNRFRRERPGPNQ